MSISLFVLRLSVDTLNENTELRLQIQIFVQGWKLSAFALTWGRSSVNAKGAEKNEL
jgi:hypothetical protein